MHKKSERFVSIFLLLICALWIGYSGRVPSATMPGAPGPNFFPFIIVGLLAFLTILNEALFFRRWLRDRKKETDADQSVKPVQAAQAGERPSTKKTILSFAVIFLFVLGIDHLGFFTSTLIAVFIILKGILAIQSWLKVLFSTAVITGSIFVIFSLLFRLPLPRGILL